MDNKKLNGFNDGLHRSSGTGGEPAFHEGNNTNAELPTGERNEKVKRNMKVIFDAISLELEKGSIGYNLLYKLQSLLDEKDKEIERLKENIAGVDPILSKDFRDNKVVELQKRIQELEAKLAEYQEPENKNEKECNCTYMTFGEHSICCPQYQKEE